MQFPGTSPSGTFGGATALTDQLRPNSLAQRKQQLIAKLASGQSSHAAFPGSGGGGLGQGDMNSFLASLFGNNGGGDGQFYGSGGAPSPQRPVDPPVNTLQPGIAIQTADPVAPAPVAPGPVTDTPAPGVTGGYNPYAAVSADWRSYFQPPPAVYNPGMRGW